MLLNLLRVNQLNNYLIKIMSHDGENIMVILSSPSGVGKTTLTKKFNKNILHLKFLYHTLQDHQGQMKLMG